MSIIKAFLLKLSSLGYQGVINTQINIYNRLKKRAPEMPENDVLNYLITSRMRARPKVASEEADAYYAPFLENPNKTLEDVIWAIVGFEFIQSRREKLFIQGYKMGLSTEEIGAQIEDFKARVKNDIRESIENRVKKRS